MKRFIFFMQNIMPFVTIPYPLQPPPWLSHLTFWMLLFSTADYSTSEMLVNMGNLPLDEFYPAVAIVTLMRILRDPSLSNHHTMVVQAVTFIFKSLGLKCVQFLPQVMPTFLNVIRVCDASIREVQFCKWKSQNFFSALSFCWAFWTLLSFLLFEVMLSIKRKKEKKNRIER